MASRSPKRVRKRQEQIRTKREYKLWTPPGAPTTGRSRPKIPLALRMEVYKRDKYRCKRCGAQDDLTLDHIRPYSKGGKTVLRNLQTLCFSCNADKGNEWID